MFESFANENQETQDANGCFCVCICPPVPGLRSGIKWAEFAIIRAIINDNK